MPGKYNRDVPEGKSMDATAPRVQELERCPSPSQAAALGGVGHEPLLGNTAAASGDMSADELTSRVRDQKS